MCVCVSVCFAWIKISEESLSNRWTGHLENSVNHEMFELFFFLKCHSKAHGSWLWNGLIGRTRIRTAVINVIFSEFLLGANVYEQIYSDCISSGKKRCFQNAKQKDNKRCFELQKCVANQKWAEKTIFIIQGKQNASVRNEVRLLGAMLFLSERALLQIKREICSYREMYMGN